MIFFTKLGTLVPSTFSSEDPSAPTKEEIFWRIWNNNDEKHRGERA